MLVKYRQDFVSFYPKDKFNFENTGKNITSIHIKHSRYKIALIDTDITLRFTKTHVIITSPTQFTCGECLRELKVNKAGTIKQCTCTK